MRSKLWVELAPASYSTGLAFLIYGQAVISNQLFRTIPLSTNHSAGRVWTRAGLLQMLSSFQWAGI